MQVTGLSAAIVNSQLHAKEAVHAGLSVLMNMSHQNPNGSKLIARCGGGAAAVDLLQLCSCQPNGAVGDDAVIVSTSAQATSVENTQAAVNRIAVLQHVDVVNVALGVLINLVSGFAGNRPLLLAWRPATRAPSAAAPSGILQLLCGIISAVGAKPGEPVADVAGGATPSKSATDADWPFAGSLPGSGGGGRRRRSAGRHIISDAVHSPINQDGSEVTEAQLAEASQDGEASIVEVYSSMLIGFLVEGDEAAQQHVARLLPGGSMSSVVDMIEKCLHFYIRTGAISEVGKETLVRLLESLKSQATGQLPAASQPPAANQLSRGV